MPRPPIPPKGASPDVLSHFLDHVLAKDTAYRIRRFRTWEKVRNYIQGDQWLETDYTEDPTRSPFWKPIEMDAASWTPTPVQNEMIAPIQNEAARLMGQGSRPYVRPDNDDPKTAKACKVGKDVLLDRLEKVGWTELEYEGSFNLALFGTWIVRSSWEIDFTKCVTVPRQALRCEACGTTLASPAIPDDQVETLLERDDAVEATAVPDPANPLVPARYKARAKGCFTCPPRTEAVTQLLPEPGPDGLPATAPVLDEIGQPIVRNLGPVPLRPYMPTDEEAKSGADFFGRRLGEEVALGDTELRNVSVYDYFPQNGGLGVNARTCQEHGEEHVESLDWISARYVNGYLVEAEDPSVLMRWHPIVGGSHFYFGGGMGPDRGVFDHHSRVREWHKEPWMENGKRNKGRSIVMAGRVVLVDGDYLIESKRSPGRYLKRAYYDSIPWEIREKELWGLGAAELITSNQDNINTTKAQVQDVRHAWGSPKIMAVEGMDLTYAGFADTGYNSDIWYYRPVDGVQQQPEPFGNQQMDTNWTQEIDREVDAIARIVGTMDVEIGNDPGFDAASALMFMGEKAAERRKPRIARLRAMKRRLYRDQLERIHEFYREKRYYSVKGRNGRDQVRAFMGEDLLGQTDVQLEDEPFYDVRMASRLNLKTAFELGSLVVDTEHDKREINKILDVPREINEQKNVQIESAQNEWIRFMEEDRHPVIKQREDSHLLHYETHVLDWMGEEAQQLKDACDWDQVELALWGWEDEFLLLQETEDDLKLNPPLDPTQGPPPLDPEGRPDVAAAQHAVEMYQARVQQQQEIAALPKPIELRLLALWTRILDKSPLVQVDPVRKRLLRWKAHFEGHYQLARLDAQKAAATPMPAPPGSPETPQGLLPSAGAPTVPGAGTGPGVETAAGGGVAA